MFKKLIELVGEIILKYIFQIYIFILVCSLCLVYFLGNFIFHQKPEALITNILVSLTVNILTALLLTLVGIEKLQKIIDKQHKQKMKGSVISIWKYSGNVVPYVLIYGGRSGGYLDETLQMTSLSDLYSLKAITETLVEIVQADKYIKSYAAAELSEKAIADKGHLIIIGGSNKVISAEMRSVLNKFKINFNVISRQIELNDTGVHTYSSKFTEDKSGKKIDEDYGVVTIACDKKTGYLFFWVAGNFGTAVYACFFIFDTFFV